MRTTLFGSPLTSLDGYSATFHSFEMSDPTDANTATLWEDSPLNFDLSAGIIRDAQRFASDHSFFRDAGKIRRELHVTKELTFAKAKEYLLRNISPPNAVPGVVVASPSETNPPYCAMWIRDAAIVMTDVVTFARTTKDASEADTLLKLLRDYVTVSHRQQLTKNRSGDPRLKRSENDPVNLDDNGEPKFKKDLSIFKEDWGRPQDDGPALRILTLIATARLARERGNASLFTDSVTVIRHDLEYILHSYRRKNFDPWEEVLGMHFYTRSFQSMAIAEALKFFPEIGEAVDTQKLVAIQTELEKNLSEHWSESQGYLLATLDQSGGIPHKTEHKDTQVLLAALKRKSGDSFSVTDDRVIATAQSLIDDFQMLYEINQERHDDKTGATYILPGTVIGRYRQDIYDGAKNHYGNPWVLLTSALAEFYFRLGSHLKWEGRIEITPRNERFFNYALNESGKALRVHAGETFLAHSENFLAIVAALKQSGDDCLLRVACHANPDGSLSEQIDRFSGFMKSAPHLTWNYSAYLNALWARDYF